METFDFKQEEFVKLARMHPGEVLKAYQSSRIVVLGMKIRDTPLTALLTLPPKGQYFALDWWLGQSYLNWRLTASFNEPLVELILHSFKQARVAFKRVPLNFLAIGEGINKKRGDGEKVIIWDSRFFLSATIPSDAVDCALKAYEASHTLVSGYLFEASHALVSDYLFVPQRDGSSYGDVLIKRAFNPRFPGTYLPGVVYRSLAKQIILLCYEKMPKPTPEQQKSFLQRLISDLEDMVVQSSSNRSETLRGADRWQPFYMYDAREFEPELTPMVVTVNTLRSRALKAVNCPHFFESVAMRRLDVSSNTLQKKYKYEANDRDWLLRLQKISPESLSPSFEELRNVDDYIAAMKEKYPCLAEDPLHKVLPRCSVQPR